MTALTFSSDSQIFTIDTAPVADTFGATTEPYSGGLNAGDFYVVNTPFRVMRTTWIPCCTQR